MTSEALPKQHRLKERPTTSEEHLVAALMAVGGRMPRTTPCRLNACRETATDGSGSDVTLSAEESDITEIVRRYEALPYPQRDPNDDKRSLRLTALDNLMTLNQYCYNGRRNFDKPFRMLVVGGGTGDSLVFLAVQAAALPGAEIVHLDLNRESMKIAQERIQNQARRLSLPNVEKLIDYRIGSLLDWERLGLGKFDYVHCGGVLHQWDDPLDGLRRLGTALNDDGALGIMVHGRLGRTGVCQIREMMKSVNRDVIDTEKMIHNTNLVLKNLPSSNLHRKNGRWLSCDPAETYDLYLHAKDRAFTFQEITDGVAAAGLTLCQFSSTMKPLLVPEYLQCKLPQRILARLAAMNPHDTAVFCEYLVGMINRYEFYVAKNKGTAVDLRDWDLIPSFSCYANVNSLKNRLQNPPKDFGDSPCFRIGVYQGSIQVPIDVSPVALASYPLIDDMRTMREIVHKLTSKFTLRTQDSIRNELLKVWRHLIAFDMIQFRHVSSVVAHVNRFHF